MRLLVAIYFILVGFFSDNELGKVLIFSSAVYLCISVLYYFYPPKREVLKSLLDIVFVPGLILISGSAVSVYSAVPFIVLYINRSYKASIVMLIAAVALTFYHMHTTPQDMFPTLILLMTSLISGLAPDLTETISKKRASMLKLKRSYNTLLKDFSRWERDRRELQVNRFLVELALKSEDLASFMYGVRESFDLRHIYILPKRKVEDMSYSKDYENGALSVPVKLEEGFAVVVFELEDPFHLKDELLVKSLVQAASMVSLFISGFSEEYYTKFKVFKIG